MVGPLSSHGDQVDVHEKETEQTLVSTGSVTQVFEGGSGVVLTLTGQSERDVPRRDIFPLKPDLSSS